jgi:hypothetical protein
MANARKANVWVVDTTGPIADAKHVCGVKLVAGADAATLTLKSDASTGGTVIFQIAAGASAETYNQVQIKDLSGLYATLTGTSPKAYIFLE